MNKSLYFIAIIICVQIICDNNIFASIIIVDNNDPSTTQYTSLYEAYQSASDGDIIYLSPSPKAYNGIAIEKKIKIYGHGFDLNKINANCKLDSILSGYIYFREGSEGSIIDGVNGGFSVRINTSNITLIHNKIGSILLEPSSKKYTNIIIINNKFFTIESTNLNSSPNVQLFALNNIISGRKNYSYYVFKYIRNGTFIFSNNIIISDSIDLEESSYTEALFSNNIILAPNISCSNCTFRYNLFDNEHKNIESSTNIFYAPEDVFIDYENQNYYLKENSPAKGSGENGTDMGIYGGFHPFVDSGLPNLPIIYSLDSTIVTSHDLGLEVIIKAKSN